MQPFDHSHSFLALPLNMAAVVFPSLRLPLGYEGSSDSMEFLMTSDLILSYLYHSNIVSNVTHNPIVLEHFSGLLHVLLSSDCYFRQAAQHRISCF